MNKTREIIKKNNNYQFQNKINNKKTLKKLVFRKKTKQAIKSGAIAHIFG